MKATLRVEGDPEQIALLVNEWMHAAGTVKIETSNRSSTGNLRLTYVKEQS